MAFRLSFGHRWTFSQLAPTGLLQAAVVFSHSFHTNGVRKLLLQMKGEAEAFAVEAKGRAEAEQMTKKAEAFKQYKEGAMVDMLLEKLPLVRTFPSS